MTLDMMRVSFYHKLRPGCDLMNYRCPVILDSNHAVISPNVGLSTLVSHFDLGSVDALMPAAQLSTLLRKDTVCAVRHGDMTVFAYENVPLEYTENHWSNTFNGREATES